MGFPTLNTSSRKNSSRILTRVILLFVSALILSCASEKLAGTEVGNPELTVSARFAFADLGDSVSITGFNVKCMGLDYQNQANTGDSLWIMPNGMMVDLADSTSKNQIGFSKIKSSAWTSAAMRLKYPSQNT